MHNPGLSKIVAFSSKPFDVNDFSRYISLHFCTTLIYDIIVSYNNNNVYKYFWYTNIKQRCKIDLIKNIHEVEGAQIDMDEYYTTMMTIGDQCSFINCTDFTRLYLKHLSLQ